jgi:hypothetical protein
MAPVILMADSYVHSKHMKRHTRPFGCTFPRCNKKFGSKNDWKRHENGQHFQVDNWRCEMLNASGDKCGQLFFNPESFKQHLCAVHCLEQQSEKISHELKIRCIGKNCQGRFWCGFCKMIIELKNREEKAWDERFDHIEREHFRNGENIRDWLCVEANRPKGEIEKEMDRRSFTSEAVSHDRVSHDELGKECSSPPRPSHQPSDPGAPPPTASSPADTSVGSVLSDSIPSRKRKFFDSYCSGPGNATTPDIDYFCV